MTVTISNEGFVPSAPSAPDADLVRALRAGCEETFAALVNRHYGSMLRVASMYAPSRTVAEEVVQEAWMGVFQGIHRFEERCSLKTWIFRILVNCAKTRARREGRSIPFSAAADPDATPTEPSVAPDRFLPAGHPDQPHHWASPPRSWGESPEERLLSQETQARIKAAIETLPPAQREVMTLRDIEGWTAHEVCEALRISDANQRVLLHRARSTVRRVLEEYLAPH